MSWLKRVCSMVLVAVILLGMCPQQTDAASDAALEGLVKQLTAQMNTEANQNGEVSTTQAPENHVPINVYLDNQPKKQQLSQQGQSQKVLLVEDVLPWDSPANQTVLGSLTEYDKVTTQEFLDVELEQYSVIVFANDQPFNTYENYAEFKEYMEIFASIGGVIVFGACDAGWSNGELIEALPGDVTKTNSYEYRNYIVDYNHPIVTGELTDGVALIDDELYSNYCSHVSFDEESLPAGTKIILRDTSSHRPTLIEYPLGKGRVIASGLTWEHNYIYGSEKGYRDYAKIAMDDMFRYAIRISSIDVDELHFLTEWRMEKNAHAIVAADATNGMSQLTPIAGADVTVDDEKFVTDEDGTVFCSNFGVRTVQISAEGYRTRKLVYQLDTRGSRVFLMERDKNDGLPYVVQASGSTGQKDEYLDLRDQSCRFKEGAQTPLIVYFEGFWDSHGEGSFILYQEGTKTEPGIAITIESGNYCSFMPGTVFKPDRQIKLKMIAGDGTESEPINLNIYIDKKPKDASENAGAALQEGMTTIDWIGNHPVESDNDIFTKLFTTDMSIKSDLSPVEIAIEHNDDGTVTYKAVIGLVSGDLTKKILEKDKEKRKNEKVEWEVPAKESWEEWKKQIKGYKDAKNPKAYLESLKKQFKDGWKPTKMNTGWEFEVEVTGYFELVLDQDGKIVHSEGGLIVKGSASTTIGQTFFAGPVPLYYEFKPGIEIEAKGGIEFYDDGGLMFRPTFNGVELAIPTISLEGGLGVQGVATGGIKGSGKLVVGFGGENITSGKLEFGGAIHIKVLFVVDYEWPFWNTSIPLWPKNKAKNMAMTSVDEITFNSYITNRSYLNNRTNWLGAAGYNSIALSPTVSLQTLQYGVMSDAMPVIHQVGDKLVMLMLQDEYYNATGNHTRLVYSVMEDGYWTNPVPVMMGSDSADMYFDSKVIDGKLYVAWQKIKTTVYADDADGLLQEVTKNSEICVATWNEDYVCFENYQYLTDDETLDMMPSIAGDGDEVYVSWVNNDANDALGTTGTNTFCQAKLGSEEMENVTLGETKDYLVEFVTECVGGKVHYAYTAMDDANQLVLYYNNGKSVKELSTTGYPMGVSFENGNLMWQENGTIYTCDAESGKSSALVQQQASASYKYLSNGTDTAIVWLDSDENGTQVMVSVLCDGQWTAPVALVSGIEENITFYDALLKEDGSVALVLNAVQTNEYGEESTVLYYTEVMPKTDVALQYAKTEYPDWANNTQQLVVYLENLGTTTVTDADLVVYSDGQEVLRQSLDVQLQPGEMKDYTVELDLEALTQLKNPTVEIVVENDENTEDNRQALDFAQVNVALEYDVYEQNNELMFVFTIVNDSAVDANVALQIFEDSLDGIVLDVKNIGVVTNDESVQYVYVVNKEKIDFNEDGRKTFFFCLEMLEADWNDNDNYCYYTVSKAPNEKTDPTAALVEYEIVDPESVNILNGDVCFESADAPSVQLEATVAPENASVTYIRWEVENADIVHITSTGLLTPLRVGTTKVTAYVTEDVKYTITVTVQDPNSADTSELEAAVEEAEDLDGSKYTKKSYAALQTALEKARRVLQNKEASQAEVDAAAKELKKAMKALTKRSDIMPFVVAGGAGALLILLIIVCIILTSCKKKRKKEK